MQNSVETHVAVLAEQVKNLTFAIHKDREADAEFRKDVRANQKETNEKLAAMQSSFDRVKGGWAVVAVIGSIVAVVGGVVASVFKGFHT